MVLFIKIINKSSFTSSTISKQAAKISLNPATIKLESSCCRIFDEKLNLFDLLMRLKLVMSSLIPLKPALIDLPIEIRVYLTGGALLVWWWRISPPSS